MPHEHGAYLGSIRCLADLYDRCVINRESGCWHMRTANGKPMPPGATYDVWMHGRGLVSFRRAAWTLKHGEPATDQLVYGDCPSYDCANPAHAKCMTRAAHGRMIRKRGTLRGRGWQCLINRESNKFRRKLTDELILWAAQSPQTAEMAAHGLGVSKSLVIKVRSGSKRRNDVSASVFDWRPAPRDIGQLDRGTLARHALSAPLKAAA